MIGVLIFLIGFATYFLVRYRFMVSAFIHRRFVKSAPRQKRLSQRVVFFDTSEVWPEHEEEKEAS